MANVDSGAGWQHKIAPAGSIAARGGPVRSLAESATNGALRRHSRAFLRLNEQIFNDQLNGFDLDFKARVTQLLGLLGIEEPSAALVGEVGEAIDKAFLELPPQIIPGALDTLDKVKRGGFRIALLSNTGMNSETLYDYWLERDRVE